MALPSTMKAITINGNKAKVSEISLPKIRPTYLLAKVEAIALNPTDWKHINGKRAAENGLAGCDFAGTVVEVGSDVTKQFQVGDRIAGTTHGANASQPEDGCFAEYAVAKADLLVKIPSTMSFEQAATFPLGVSTVGQGLYQKALKLHLPTDPISPQNSQTLLIYGGSTATGSLAIQFAKASGYKVLTTCSPHNNDFVRSLGADAVYNYKSPDVGKQINRDTENSLTLIWDTISLASSAAICSEAFSSDPSILATGAKYGTILPITLPSPSNANTNTNTNIQTTMTFMYTIFNEPFTKAHRTTPSIPEDFAFAKLFFQITEDMLLLENKILPHPQQVGENGLEGALHGMEEMKRGSVSGRKLVYRVGETPERAVGVEVEL